MSGTPMCAAEDKNEFLRRSHSPFVIFQEDRRLLLQAPWPFEETYCKSRTLSNFFHRLPCANKIRDNVLVLYQFVTYWFPIFYCYVNSDVIYIRTYKNYYLFEGSVWAADFFWWCSHFSIWLTGSGTGKVIFLSDAFRAINSNQNYLNGSLVLTY